MGKRWAAMVVGVRRVTRWGRGTSQATQWVDQAFLYRSSQPTPRAQILDSHSRRAMEYLCRRIPRDSFGEAVRLISSGQRNQLVVKSRLDAQSVCI